MAKPIILSESGIYKLEIKYGKKTRYSLNEYTLEEAKEAKVRIAELGYRRGKVTIIPWEQLYR